MRICVVGAGAVGGFLAAKLASAGEEVSVVDLGAHLARIRSHGLLLHEEGRATVARVDAFAEVSAAGVCDLIILAVKAHQVANVAGSLPAIMGPQTSVLTVQNGIPWWYFFKYGGAHEGRRLDSVDPGGTIADNLAVDRIVAGIVYPGVELSQPGVIRHIEGDRISLAEIDGSKSARIARICEIFCRAGLRASVIRDIRAAIWTKLWGNAAFNPISALTHATMEEIGTFELTRTLVSDVMIEVQTVGEAFGIRFRISREKRIAGAEAVGAHKTSMLQDVECGRLMEANAILGAVLELGRIGGVETPRLQTLYATVKLLDETLARRGGRLVISSA